MNLNKNIDREPEPDAIMRFLSTEAAVLLAFLIGLLSGALTKLYC